MDLPEELETVVALRTLLALDDHIATLAPALRAALEGYELLTASRPREALDVLEREAARLGCVLCDLQMPPEIGADPSREGLAFLRAVRERWPEIPVIMLSVVSDIEVAMEAVRELGAYYYLTKPPKVDKLREVVAAACAAREEVHSPMSRVQGPKSKEKRPPDDLGPRTSDFGLFIGSCPAMRAVYRLIERVAASEAAVLVLGESGTGKELVAREIHSRSRRAGGPFVTRNCAAIPRELVESELFGHRKGSFTGAIADKDGDFRQAHQGTLFLDEIGDMESDPQKRILRALEGRTVRPIGATADVPADVRIVAATNQNLARLIKEGRFREDLYWRLNGIVILLPRLCDRGPEDILALSRHFLALRAKEATRPSPRLSPEAEAALCTHSWPGNVRELRKAIERAMALADGDVLRPEDLQLHRLDTPCAPSDDSTAALDALKAAYLAGTAEILPLKEFRNRHGEHALAGLLRWALAQKNDVRAAGRLLGFIGGPDEDGRQYDNVRHWMSKLKITKRGSIDR